MTPLIVSHAPVLKCQGQAPGEDKHRNRLPLTNFFSQPQGRTGVLRVSDPRGVSQLRFAVNVIQPGHQLQPAAGPKPEVYPGIIAEGTRRRTGYADARSVSQRRFPERGRLGTQ
jgi:hypothetical protein